MSLSRVNGTEPENGFDWISWQHIVRNLVDYLVEDMRNDMI